MAGRDVGRSAQTGRESRDDRRGYAEDDDGLGDLRVLAKRVPHLLEGMDGSLREDEYVDVELLELPPVSVPGARGSPCSPHRLAGAGAHPHQERVNGWSDHVFRSSAPSSVWSHIAACESPVIAAT